MEQLPTFLSFLAVAGARFPGAAALAGAAFLVGRIFYFKVSRSPKLPLLAAVPLASAPPTVAQATRRERLQPKNSLRRPVPTPTHQGYASGDPKKRIAGPAPVQYLGLLALLVMNIRFGAELVRSA